MIQRLLETVAEHLRAGFTGMIAPQDIAVGDAPKRDINVYSGSLTARGQPERAEVSGRLRIVRDFDHELFVCAHSSDPALEEQWLALALAMIATERDNLLAAVNQLSLASPYQAGEVSSLCQIEQLVFRRVRSQEDDLEALFAVSGKLVMERDIEATGLLDLVTLETNVS